MKKIFLLILILAIRITTMACPTCEAQKPKILQGLTSHGSGPSSNWDYLAGSITLIIVLAVLYYAIKWIIHPGEKEENHIKRNILNF
ncbi:MAG: hypothetical protein ABI359_11795 [Ginsengibacter sp.]